MFTIRKTDMKNHKMRWLLQSTLALLLTGAGLCLSIDAGMQKFNNKPWVGYGTFALVVFNAGLCLLVDAGVRKMKNN
jgi:hypothetical protein